MIRHAMTDPCVGAASRGDALIGIEKFAVEKIAPVTVGAASRGDALLAIQNIAVKNIAARRGSYRCLR